MRSELRHGPKSSVRAVVLAAAARVPIGAVSHSKSVLRPNVSYIRLMPFRRLCRSPTASPDDLTELTMRPIIPPVPGPEPDPAPEPDPVPDPSKDPEPEEEDDFPEGKAVVRTGHVGP